MAKSQELVPMTALADAYPVLFGADPEMTEIMRENLGSEGVRPLDLDRIGIPAGGGTQWIVPTLDGEDSVKELTGILIAWKPTRTFWKQSIEVSGGSAPPDCSSEDGEVGFGEYGANSASNPSGQCAVCPMNEYGSQGLVDGSESRAKACKEMRQLFIVRPGGVLPVVVTLPPTSILPLRKYFLRLASESVPYYGVVTSIGLERVSSGGYTWSVATFKAIERLDADARARVKDYSESFKPQIAATLATPRGASADDE